MNIDKTYQFKLKLTKGQEKRLDQWIGTCRFVYNIALETKIYAYKSKRVNLSCYDLQKQLPLIKDVDWVKDVPSASLQDVIERMDKAYASFFRGGGFPKWAKKNKYKSITFKCVKENNGRIFLPKIGGLKYFSSQEIKGEIKRATVVKKSDGYYISVSTKQPQPTVNRTHNNQVGIDMGIAFFASLSSGCKIENPRYIKKYERQLRIEQRSLSRKKKDSRKYIKQLKRVRKIHNKISNSRKDFLHKVSSDIIFKNSFVAIEDLNVSNMAKHGNLSKSISDASWSTFFRLLNYKGKWYGSEIIRVNPMFTSQTCNNCGLVDRKSRVSQSKYTCISCGTESDADVNAAKNILGRAVSSLT